jgi:murein DD-endopeptidase MepM/ murein hydrolase activator NlpD
MKLARFPAAIGLAVLICALPSSARVEASSRWDWPVDQPHLVLRGFQRPPATWKAGHRGVDIAATTGTPVRAAADGTVTFVGLVAAKGVVTIDHGAVRTTYEPVLPLVLRGQRVRKGDVIATVAPGWSHCSPLGTPLCLHWGARRGATYIDPMSLLSRHARLLPLTPR